MIFDYAKWHYGRGFQELVKIIGNFLLFILHLFSIKLLIKTLFHPWRRMSEAYAKGLDAEAIFSSFVVNTIMRVVGFVSRFAIIIIGLFSLILVMILGIFLVVFWLCLPVIILTLFAVSISLILKSTI